jgi:hypothetical protein
MTKELTSIFVDKVFRDRLKSCAAKKRLTMRELLEILLTNWEIKGEGKFTKIIK